MRRGFGAAIAALCVACAVAPAAFAERGSLGAGRDFPVGDFRVGAAVGDLSPPPFGRLANDPADCANTPALRAQYNGRRAFAFEEPYRDLQHSGHYDLGDPYLDCNGDGRWDGNLLGGGADTPRFYTRVADPVGARALVVSNGHSTIAVEVVDQEGLFNIYQDEIRSLV